MSEKKHIRIDLYGYDSCPAEILEVTARIVNRQLYGRDGFTLHHVEIAKKERGFWYHTSTFVGDRMVEIDGRDPEIDMDRMNPPVVPGALKIG